MWKYPNLLLFIIFLNQATLLGQNEFYSTASSSYVGVKLIDGGDRDNSRFCKVKKGEQILIYTPYEVTEYGFRDGRRYVSKEIRLPDSTQRVFLERLAKGKINLYYYQGKGIKTFFWEKDTTLFIELTKHGDDPENSRFNDYLYNLTSDCKPVSDAVSLIKYSKLSLKEYADRYNRCDRRPFPRFKYGLIAGYGVSRLSSPDGTLKAFNYPYDGSIIAGLFIDQPFLLSNYSLHTEIYYSSNGYACNFRDENKDMDLLINTAAVSMPILIRYTYPSVRYSPFINLGGIYSFQFKNENALYEATIIQDVIEINAISENTLLSQNLLGFSVGGGLEYHLNYRHSLFLELRYHKLYSIINSGSLNKTVVQCNIGIGF